MKQLEATYTAVYSCAASIMVFTAEGMHTLLRVVEEAGIMRLAKNEANQDPDDRNHHVDYA